MHGLGPAKTSVEAALGEEPESYLRSVVTCLFAIEEEGRFALGELLGPASDLVDLIFGDAVGHDRDGWDAEVVEADHVVERLPRR